MDLFWQVLYVPQISFVGRFMRGCCDILIEGTMTNFLYFLPT